MNVIWNNTPIFRGLGVSEIALTEALYIHVHLYMYWKCMLFIIIKKIEHDIGNKIMLHLFSGYLLIHACTYIVLRVIK